jgi:putative transposase
LRLAEAVLWTAGGRGEEELHSEQMLHTVRRAEGGTPVAEVCRKTGITEQTFYKWKRRVAGMGIAELARLRQLEDENKKLKSLVADLTLDKHMLQEVLRKKF